MTPSSLDTANKEFDTLVRVSCKGPFCVSKGSVPRHSPQFKLQLCTDIHRGKIGRREVQQEYRISAELVQLWLTQYDRSELDAEEVAEDEARITALERTVGHSILLLTNMLSIIEQGQE